MNSLMLHSGPRDFCDHQGWLGFYLCGDQETIVLLCEECDTVYVSPNDKNNGVPSRLGDAPHFLIEAIGIPAAGGRDATRAEILAKGWGSHIEGEYAYNVKGKGSP